METISLYLTGVLAVLLLTSFVKIATTINILKLGLGLHGFTFSLVVFAISLSLSLLVMTPLIDKVGGFKQFFEITQSEAGVDAEFRPFLEKHSDPKIIERFSSSAQKLAGASSTGGKTPLSVLSASFLISELRDAFQIGFLILVPFLVVDLIVVNVLMLLGITQISAAVVSLPIKILLFFAVDGWTLISEKLIQTYF